LRFDEDLSITVYCVCSWEPSHCTVQCISYEKWGSGANHQTLYLAKESGENVCMAILLVAETILMGGVECCVVN